MILILTPQAADQRNRAEATKRKCKLPTDKWWAEFIIGNYVGLDVGNGDGLESWEVEMCEEMPEDEDYTPNRYTLTEQGNRANIFTEMKATADATLLDVAHAAFYLEHKAIFDYWLIHGGGQVRELIEAATEEWWDLKETPEGKSAKEFALELLG